MNGAIISIFGFAYLIGSVSAAAHPKIVGGEDAWIKKFPYLVSIRVYGWHSCGGSIISDRHILTAAHCVYDFNEPGILDLVTVHSGVDNRHEEGFAHRVNASHIHPKYTLLDERNLYDIAILTLKDPIVFDKHQQKIGFPTKGLGDYQTGYIVGWGRVSKDKSWNFADQLQKAKVVLLPIQRCQRYVTRELHSGQVCSFRMNIGTCHGDSGGPLVSEGKLVGIVSYTEGGKCSEDIPDVYTNVYAYKDFIEETMKL